MPTLSSLEQDVVNVASLAEQAMAALISANNPQYSGIISTLSGVGSAVTSGLGLPAVTSTLPQDLVATVVPTIAAVNTISSKTATAAQKATALAAVLQNVTQIGEDVWSFVTGFLTHKSTTSAPAAPAAAGSPASTS